MDKIRLAIVGCGGMGHRHLKGVGELDHQGLSRFDLVAACDPNRANAESLADEAEALLGTRPEVVTDLDQLEQVGVDAIDVPTTPRFHHTIAIDAIERGWHCMIEKPVGLTVRACNLIAAAAKDRSQIVSVAENYRRDPMNRLARALLDAGVIGDPRLLLHHSLGGNGNNMIISVWRHQKNQSGLLLDVGVHFTDMMEYLLGDITTVYAQTRLHEKVRYNPAARGEESKSNPSGVYGKWQKEMPAEFEATAEDAAYATLTFSSGAVGQYVEDHAIHGDGSWLRQIQGSSGSMTLPPDRKGAPLSVNVSGKRIEGDDVLDLVPDFRLNEATAKLFGGERLGRFQFEFPEIDRKIIATEYADFGDAIANGRPPEVDIIHGTRSVAIAYAMMESGLSGEIVSVDDVIAEKVDAYQAEINQDMKI
jgi:predicted dehydrogenase